MAEAAYGAGPALFADFGGPALSLRKKTMKRQKVTVTTIYFLLCNMNRKS